MTLLTPIAADTLKVIDYLDRYEKVIEEVAPFFNLEGRKIVEICQNIPKKTFEFRKYASELKAIYELIDLRRGQVESKKYRNFNESYSRALSQKDIQQYVKGDKEFVDLSEVLLEIQLLRQNVDAIIEALNVMHWQMNNVTRMHCASLSEEII